MKKTTHIMIISILGTLIAGIIPFTRFNPWIGLIFATGSIISTITLWLTTRNKDK